MLDGFIDFLRMASVIDLDRLYVIYGLTVIIEDGSITGYEYH